MTEYILKTEAGVESFPVTPGSHTIIFDTTFLRQKAIGEFVTQVIKSPKPRSDEEFIGIAIGYFKTPLDTFRPDVKDIYELDDKTLVSIIRWSKKFDEDHKKGED